MAVTGSSQSTRGTQKVGGLAVGAGGISHSSGQIDARWRVAPDTVSIDLANAATVARTGTPVTVTGAVVGDLVVASPPAALNDDLIFCGAAVTDDDEVTVYVYNPTGGAINDTARDWIIGVLAAS